MENERRIPSNKLNDVVDCLINSLMPKAYSNKSFFVNDIPDHFQLEKELPVITSVLGGLLSTVISNVKDSCIRLSAKLYGNIVLVDVKNSNGFNPHALRGKFQQLQALAEKNKGTITFATHQQSITSVTFGFHS
ncbi:MAG TPA: hypothetical protein VJU78_03915 [Chitinophagaceae bacterium]|nr:hypothetical protein [Chitinophagaceae bacterium]